MKSLTFAKRNIKEYLRTPLILFFTLFFPILMFFIFQIIKLGTGAGDIEVPMFMTNNIIPSIAVFSYTFITLSISLQISKDRTTSFQSRLMVSPMKSVDFFLGYFIPCLITAFFQTILCFIIGLIFGLSVSINLLWAFVCLMIISTFYISIGILLGSLFSDKSCGGISSLVVNMTAIFSGMFFPLQEGTFKNILSLLPFYPSVSMVQGLINNNYTNFLNLFLVFICYTIITITTTILVFRKKLKTR